MTRLICVMHKMRHLSDYNPYYYTPPHHPSASLVVRARVLTFICCMCGVYSPGNVELRPEILKNSQDYIQKTYKTGEKPVYFVFHGGSGAPQHQIREAISYGAIKMNIDTDMQWAYWEGIKDYYKSKEGYLQSQIGNPEGEDSPNKKYYDPRVWLRKGEENFVKRLTHAFGDLNCLDVNSKL